MFRLCCHWFVKDTLALYTPLLKSLEEVWEGGLEILLLGGVQDTRLQVELGLNTDKLEFCITVFITVLLYVLLYLLL